MDIEPPTVLAGPGIADPPPIPDQARPHKRLPPGQWAKKNLFNTWYNSILTIVLGAALVFLAIEAFQFVFVNAPWQPVTDNLTLFMIGRFPRDEQWRIVAQIILWSAAGGLAWGAAVAGAKFRAMQSGIPYVEDSTLSKVRRYWALLFLLIVLLLGTTTVWPLVLTTVSFAIAAVIYQLGSRVPGQYTGLLWAGVAVVSIWPGLVLTERTQAFAQTGRLDFEGAESQRFTGRAIAHLAADSDVLASSGRAITSRELADRYGFRDVDGGLPKGPMHHRPGGLS